MKGLISIIIPVYNVEKYLEDCLFSVVNQTYKNLEIIIVNDNSPDNSIKIIERFAKTDKRIIVISQKANGGYGKAINTGFKKATGEFIGIVESDDFIAKNMYETLYKAALKTDAEIIKCNHYHYKTTKGTPQSLLNIPSEKLSKSLVNNRKFAKLFIEETGFIELDESSKVILFESSPPIWAALYRTDFIKSNSLQIIETEGASYQDFQFLCETIFEANKIYLIPDNLYFYRIDNPNSSINSKEKVLVIFNLFYNTYQSLEQRDIERLLTVRHRIFYGFFKTFYWNFYRLSNHNRRIFLLEWQKAMEFMIEKSFDTTWLPQSEQRDIYYITHNLDIAYLRLAIRYIFIPIRNKIKLKYLPKIIYFILFRMVKRIYRFAKQ
ncbi:glycosyltransferase fzmily 2 [Candidatus Hepatincola sp. Av]